MQETYLFRLLTHRPKVQIGMLYATFGLMVLGIWFALIPIQFPEVGITFTDKIFHAAAFLGFAALLDVSSERSFWRWKVPVLLGYGALIELFQSLTPWRSFSMMDWVADGVGLVLYWAVWWWVLRRFVQPDRPI